MTDKIKVWWSEDRKWLCVLVNDGVSQATVSLTPEEAAILTGGVAQSPLETLIEEYARDLRKSSSGDDDLPATADYLETLIERAHTFTLAQAAQVTATVDDLRCAYEAFQASDPDAKWMSPTAAMIRAILNRYDVVPKDAAQPPAAPVETKAYKCGAGCRGACNWPVCDCDPKANEIKRGLMDDGWRPDPQCSAATESDLAAKLKEAHQQRVALWHAIAGGPEPRCRDCADFNGRCQGDDLPCDPQERALERIKHLRAVPQGAWQSIETAPFVSAKRYLIVNASEIPVIGFRYYPDGPWYDEHGHSVNPLAWQELPSYSLTRPQHSSEVREALEIAEDVLSRAPFSTAILPNGMHPQVVIEKIRAALAATHPRGGGK